jgi:hypothetical protein
MAGDWLKMELELSDKPEVHYNAGALNIDPDAVVGKLFRVWCWFNKHTVDGNAHGVTFALVDRCAGVTGFGEAMSFAGWLEQRDKVLHMPHFDYHTSESAKKRALTAKRAANHRKKSNAESNANSNAAGVTNALPREEKRRVNTKADAFNPSAYLADRGVVDQTVSDWLRLRKAKKAEVTQTAIEGIQKEAEKVGYSLNDALAMCCARGWQGFEAAWVKDKPAPNAPKRFSL